MVYKPTAMEIEKERRGGGDRGGDKREVTRIVFIFIHLGFVKVKVKDQFVCSGIRNLMPQLLPSHSVIGFISPFPSHPICPLRV
jgi:hypothetical protein